MSTGLSCGVRHRNRGQFRRGRLVACSAAVNAAVEILESRTLLTAVLSDVADSYIRNNGYASTNFGAAPALYVKNASSGDTRIAFLKFDLSSVGTITSAVLRATGTLEYPESTPVTMDVYPVNDTSWVEGSGTIDSRNGNGTDVVTDPAAGITWNNAPAPSPGPVASATMSRYGLQTYTWDLTSYLQQEKAAGINVVSFALDTVESGALWEKFLSRESGPYGPQLVINGTGSPAPTATVSAADVADPNTNPVPVFVTYSGELPIDPSTINAGNITVSGPAGTLPVVAAFVNSSVSPAAKRGNGHGNGKGNGGGEAGSATPATAEGPTVVEYDVNAPAGGWTAADNGFYTVVVNPNQVADTGGGTAISSEGTFRVAVNDNQPPAAAITAAPNVTAPATTYQFAVTFTDNVAIDPSWVDMDNVGVTGPNGQALTVVAAQVDNAGPGTPRTATYTVAAPNGTWSAADDGTYTIDYRVNQVRDTAGLPAAPTTATFAVAFPMSPPTPPPVPPPPPPPPPPPLPPPPPPPVADTTPPAASISAPDVTSPGGTSEAVVVTYSDDVAVDVSTINVNNIRVTGPGGPLAVTGVQFAAGNGTPVTVTYIVAAPGGSWGPGDNGAYAIALVAGSVKDTSGNGVGAADATFQVSATLPDTTPPSAQIQAPDITAGGSATETVTVVYTDNVAVNAASVSPGNLTVTGPNGALQVMAAHAQGGTGSPLVVTYTVAAPHGTWSSADDGSYVVALSGNPVTDTSGNPAGAASGSFSVSIPTPPSSPTDQTFANGQSVQTNFVTEAIATEPDGKILAVGHQDAASGVSQGVIERFNANGTVDASFGAGGKIVSVAGVDEAYYAIALQDAGHFIVAGVSAGDFVLTRYTLGGLLDAAFGAGGRVTTDFGTSTDTARSVAIGPGGMIVAGGDAGGNFAFARYDANGHLDPNFAQNGRQLYALGSGDDGLGGVAVDGTGRVIAAGSEGASVVLVRLTPSGESDGTFGSGGLVTVPGLQASTGLGQPDRSEGLAVQSDGEILVAKHTPSGHFGIVRVNPTGQVDPTFGSGGIAAADFGGADDADSLVLQSNGEIIAIGTSLQGNTPTTAVAAFDSAGNALTNFGSGGKVMLPVQTAIAPSVLHVGGIVLRAFGTTTPDGRVVVGTTNEAVSATTSSTLRRLLVPGALVGSAPTGTFLGNFGIVNGKKARLTFTDADGTKITLALVGGTGQAYLSGDRVRILVNDLGRGVALTIAGRGGDGRISLSDVTISGTLRSLQARNSDLFGTLHVTGAIGTLTLGRISGAVWSGAAIAAVNAGDLEGTVFATGALGRLKFGNVSGTVASGSGVIGTLAALSMDNARVLSGANLGADGTVGGTGVNADTYNAGSIGSIKIVGMIASSFIGAGVNPVDRTFGNSDDKVIGGAASRIGSVTAKSADKATRFEAGAFGKAKLGKTVNVASDSRFRLLGG